MKPILSIIVGLLIAANALADPSNTNVTVRLVDAHHVGPHSNVWFLCSVTIANHTGVPLTVTNLFARFPGLALKISGLDGKELKRTYAVALHNWTWTLPAGSQRVYKLMYGVPAASGSYQNPGISLPATARTVRLQIEGTLSGSTYNGSITSNVAEVTISE